MKTISLTKLFTILAASFVVCVSAQAQTTAPGDATVDPVTGELVLGDGTRIAPPAGEVNVDGNLVIDGTTITAPVATVNADGSINVDGTTLQVPEVPLTIFFSNLFQYTNPEQAGWYYSDIINHFWNGASVGNDGWIFWEDWGILDQSKAWFFVNTSAGSEEGFWAWSNYLNSWSYFFIGGNGFSRLADGATPQQGWFYVATPPSGDNWYYYDQYYADWAGGARVGLITNNPNPAPEDWIRLR